jgi:hypothetical protein
MSLFLVMLIIAYGFDVSFPIWLYFIVLLADVGTDGYGGWRKTKEGEE